MFIEAGSSKEAFREKLSKGKVIHQTWAQGRNRSVCPCCEVREIPSKSLYLPEL